MLTIIIIILSLAPGHHFLLSLLLSHFFISWPLHPTHTFLNSLVELKSFHSLQATNQLTRAGRNSGTEMPGVSRICHPKQNQTKTDNQLVLYEKQVLRSFSLMPNIPTALVTHPFPSSLCAKFAPGVVVSFFPGSCSDDPQPERAAAGQVPCARPRSLPTTAAAVARYPPLPTGPDWAPLPVLHDHVLHLNGTVARVRRSCATARTAPGNKGSGRNGPEGTKKRSAFAKSPLPVFPWTAFLSPLGNPASSTAGTACCSAHASHLKIYFVLPCLSPAVLSLVTLVTPPRRILAEHLISASDQPLPPSPSKTVLIIRTKISFHRFTTHTIDTIPKVVLMAEELIEFVRKERIGRRAFSGLRILCRQATWHVRKGIQNRILKRRKKAGKVGLF